MSRRKGLGKGKGQGFKNIIPPDPIVHGMSARGIKQRQPLTPQAVTPQVKEEGYSGWKNKETWAVKLHWDNNAGDYEYFTEQAKQYLKDKRPLHEFADFLQETAEEVFDSVIHKPEEANQEARLFVDDVGSLWRVDWREIATSYFNEVKEEEEWKKRQKKLKK